MIDWGAFLLVAAVSIGSAALVVGLFATGLRLLAVEGVRRAPARLGAYAAFVVDAAAVLFGISLLIPALHGG